MFAHRLRLSVGDPTGAARPVPLDWLDRFFMRHFTGLSALDDTLPAGDGVLEIGSNVDVAVLEREFEKWLRGHKLLTQEQNLVIERL